MSPRQGARQAVGEESALEDVLGHRFRDRALLARALRHPSAAERHSDSYQRLEFLGDRVLGLVVAAMLIERFPEEKEGALARRFAALVRRDTLARVARELELGRHVELGHGEDTGGGRDNPANLADACEAVIAALYLDGGLDAARGFVRVHWEPLMAEDAAPPSDAKTALQEWAQSTLGLLPVYRTIATAGPAHAPRFEVEVRVGDRPAVTAFGASKRAAEQAAARRLLEAIGQGDG